MARSSVSGWARWASPTTVVGWLFNVRTLNTCNYDRVCRIPVNMSREWPCLQASYHTWMAWILLAKAPNFTPLAVSGVAARTRTTLEAVNRVVAADARVAGPLLTCHARLTGSPIAYISTWASSTLGSIGCVSAFNSVETGRWLTRARVPGMRLTVVSYSWHQRHNKKFCGLCTTLPKSCEE